MHGFTIDIDPTNGAVYLDAGELRSVAQNNITKEKVRSAVIETMVDYVRKHTAKGLDRNSIYYSAVMAEANKHP